MDIRQKIIGLLNKIDSETLLKRIYEFIKYIYICLLYTSDAADEL